MLNSNWYKLALLKNAGRFANDIPAMLSGLIAEAIKCETFEEFKHDYSVDIKHGLYWHVTKKEDFFIDPEKGPRDYSSMSIDREPAKGKLMITSNLERWVEEFHDIEENAEDWAYQVVDVPYWDYFDSAQDITDDGIREIAKENPVIAIQLEEYKIVYDDVVQRRSGSRRNWVAQIDMSNVPRNAYHQVNRGFGNEFFVDDPSQAKVVRIIPIEEAVAYDELYDNMIPQSLEELLEFYNSVHRRKI